ncbi:MAG: EscU/YscU/HrcU family type III secretion system export apparatus switch protein [Gammaproteobacteria bacterium]|nr:EscU/YscU/HrcU family type III secretion system export apparatus switch protein [Gammaproteobacteria bacterium]MCF6230444.1 EscU/YscU/HrcU family type III secretion system export apparatus switch protein [Gammaproteobacteria bacterium]
MGHGELAGQIIGLAKRSDIPLVENAYLVELLLALNLGDEIPEDLYLSVAEMIDFAYWLSDRRPASGH